MFLCLDQGTHASRALLINQQGAVVATATQSVALNRLDDYHVEQDPMEIFDSLFQVIAEILQCGAKPQKAALACQRSSIVCWRRSTGEPLSPVLSWQDRRAAQQLESIRQEEDKVRRLTGLPLSPHYGASKIAWCIEHLPEVQQAQKSADLVCSPLSSFLHFHLCRNSPICVDASNAARTLLWNLHNQQWDEELAELFSIPLSLLPQCVNNRYAFGALKQLQDCPLDIIIGDQAAALFANGQPRQDSLYINLGTGGFISSPFALEALGNTPLLSSLLLAADEEKIYCLEGTVNGCDAAIQWYLQQHPQAWQEIRPDEASDIFFLNGIGGLGSPFWRPLNSRFIGEGTSTQQFLALLESIIFLVQENIEIIKAKKNQDCQFILSGGLANHHILCQWLADLNQSAVRRSQEKEATAKGLAYLLCTPTERQNWQSQYDIIQPQANTAIRDRYAKWRRHLQAALVH